MGPDSGGTSWRDTVETRQKKRACAGPILLENPVRERLVDDLSYRFSRSLAPNSETNLAASSEE